MARTLRYVGLVLLAAAACFLLSGAVGWLPAEDVKPWVGAGVKAGVLCLGAGILLAMLSPIGRELRRGRCARCGAVIERGQTYCRDHLQQAVNEYRDQTREGILQRPGGRG